MTKKGSTKRVDDAYALGRLRRASAFHELARLGLEQLARVREADVVEATVILAAIAYTDAVTAAWSGEINQKDHSAAVQVLRDALGKALPDAQERCLRRLLGRKDEVSYGARVGRPPGSLPRTLADLDEYARWATEKLRERGVVLRAPREDGQESA